MNVEGTRTKVDSIPRLRQTLVKRFQRKTFMQWEFRKGNPSLNQDMDVDESRTSFFVTRHGRLRATPFDEVSEIKVSNDGTSFQGTEQVTVRSPNSNEPRAVVTYELVGRRVDSSK